MGTTLGLEGLAAFMFQNPKRKLIFLKLLIGENKYSIQKQVESYHCRYLSQKKIIWILIGPIHHMR